MNIELRRGTAEPALREALDRLINGRYRLRLPAQPYDDDLLLAGAIEELVALRAERAQWEALRPAVQAFAREMEARLRKHDATRGERGWRVEALSSLFARLREEVCELESAVFLRDPAGIVDEAADVANFAMFLADNAYGLLPPVELRAATPADPVVAESLPARPTVGATVRYAGFDGFVLRSFPAVVVTVPDPQAPLKVDLVAFGCLGEGARLVRGVLCDPLGAIGGTWHWPRGAVG